MDETWTRKLFKNWGAFLPTREAALACPNTCVSKQGSTSTPNGTMFWPGNPDDARCEVIVMSQRRINRGPEDIRPESATGRRSLDLSQVR